MTLPTEEDVRCLPLRFRRGDQPQSLPAFPADADGPVRTARYTDSLCGLLCSLVVHGGLVLGMTYIVFEYSSDDVGSLVGVMGQPANELVADLILEAPEVRASEGAEAPSELESLTERLSDAHTRRIIQSTLPGAGDGTGTGEGAGDDSALAVPAVSVPSYAVTKGSFSAWTEPKDPEPLKAYIIRIVVHLPGDWEKSSKFRMKDISGMVIGTDGYKQAIRFKPTQTVLIQNGAVQIDIRVPGARKLVRDTIRIESKLLKEKQVIQLVF